MPRPALRPGRHRWVRLSANTRIATTAVALLLALALLVLLATRR